MKTSSNAWTYLRSPRLALAAVAAGTLALGAVDLAAWGGMPPAPQVTGTVSAVVGTTGVTIDGTTYLVAPNSPAAAAIRAVSVGETIGLILNGPAGVGTSQVVLIETGAGMSAGAGDGRSR